MASQVFLIVAHGLTKCSVLALIRQLFTSSNIKQVNLMTAAGLGLCGAWALASVIAITAGCSPLHIFEGGVCHSGVSADTIVSTLTIMTDLHLRKIAGWES
jgi:hypothetical protein